MSQQVSKRQKLREKRAREQARGRILTIAGIVLLVGVLFVLFILPNLFPPEVVFHDHPAANGNAMGSADAPITITEYSDFQCPYCRRFWDETEAQLIEAYVATGKVLFVYRSFGAFIGAESQASAEAAYCAGDQGKFWDMHDIIFTNQGGENAGTFSNARLTTFAKTIGLNLDEYKTCMSSGKYADTVTQDGKDGVAAGIEATPSFVITYVVNGETKTRIIKGAQPFAAFQSEIEAALAEMGLK